MKNTFFWYDLISEFELFIVAYFIDDSNYKIIHVNQLRPFRPGILGLGDPLDFKRFYNENGENRWSSSRRPAFSN